MIMFGLGGVLTEVLDDVSFRVLPITEEDARQMTAELRGARVLRGFRGRRPVSEKLLVDLLLNAARFGLAFGDRLDAVDLNPVLVWDDRHVVLDSKVVLADPHHATADADGSGGAAARTPSHRPPTPLTWRPSSRPARSPWWEHRTRPARSATRSSTAWPSTSTGAECIR